MNYTWHLAVAATICSFILGVDNAWAQTKTAAAPPPTFEVASVKPAAPGPNMEYSLRSTTGRIDWRNVPFLELLKRAYGLPDYQIKGPAWIKDQRYDISANFQPPNTPERLKAMLQRLLSERFRLRFHYDTQPIQGYRLTIVEGGLKMKESRIAATAKAPGTAATGNDQEGPAAPRRFPALTPDRDGYPILPEGVSEGQNFATGQTRISFKAQPMQFLVQVVTAETGQPVLDATNLKGKYDIHLQWVSQKTAYVAPELLERNPSLAQFQAKHEGETMASALKRQLGLNLKAEKVPFQILVVDYADRFPSAN